MDAHGFRRTATLVVSEVLAAMALIALLALAVALALALASVAAAALAAPTTRSNNTKHRPATRIIARQHQQHLHHNTAQHYTPRHGTGMNPTCSQG